MSGSSNTAMATRPLVLITTYGTRGDVQPYLAMAVALMHRQMDVIFATHGEYKDWVLEYAGHHGVATEGDLRTKSVELGSTEERKGEEKGRLLFITMYGAPAAVMRTEEFRRAVYEGNKMEQARMITAPSLDFMKRNMRLLHVLFLKYTVDRVLSSLATAKEVVIFCRHYNVPVAVVSPAPFTPSSTTAPIGVDNPVPLGFVNSTLHSMINFVDWKICADLLTDVCTELLLDPKPARVNPRCFPLVLNVFSPNVALVPDDWPETVRTLGYWVLPLPDAFEPSPPLAAFLEAGSAPVYMGFGPMPVKDAAALVVSFGIILAAVGKRGIFCTKQEMPQSLVVPENVIIVDDVPHEWLFPRCCAAIHHGGAGTTGASIRAGIPTYIFSLFVDQPYWASRVVALGVGNKAVAPLTSLDKTTLERAVNVVTNTEVIEAAAKLGELVSGERDGIEAALDVLERHWETHKRPRHADGTPIVVEWMQDKDVTNCSVAFCEAKFTLVRRKHHCRSCGAIVCSKCCSKFPLPLYADEQLVCQPCVLRRSPEGAVTVDAAAGDAQLTLTDEAMGLIDDSGLQAPDDDTVDLQAPAE